MPRGIRILRWLNIGVVLLYLIGVYSIAVAQQGSIQEAEALIQQAHEFYDQGRFTDAIPLASRALEIREQVLGPEHPNTAMALNSLAMLYRSTKAYSQAEPLFRRALSIAEKVLGPEHPNTAISLDNLAMLYRDTGAYGQAELLLKRTLVIREKTLGSEHPDTAKSLNKLAELYRIMGAYQKAEPLLKRALSILEKVLGPEHRDTATSLNNLALLYADTGAYSKAEPLYLRALAIQEKMLGPEHSETATSLNNLALLYTDTGAYGQAEPLLTRALAIQEGALGPEHPQTVSTLNNLAMLYQNTGAYEQSEPLIKRALSINEKVLGPDHPDTATSLNNLALLHRYMGDYEQAEPLYQRALAIREKVLGYEHPHTATSLQNLAELYQATGAYGQTEPLYRRALAIQEKKLGPDHLDTARSFHNLAAFYGSTGAYGQAEPLYQRALAIWEKVLGPDHPHIATSLNNLWALYWATGDLSRARLLISRAQAIREKNLATFLLTGSESRKQVFLEKVGGETFAQISLSLATPNRQTKGLGLGSVLMTKGRVLDAMSDSIGRLRQSVKPSDRALLDELAALAQLQSTLTHQGPGKLQPEAYSQRLQELASRQEQLQTELSTRSAEFRRQVAPVTLAAVQAAIPKGAALIESYRYKPFDPKGKDQQSRWGKPRYVAYVVKPKGEPAAVDVGDAESIEHLIHDFRTGLSNPTHIYVKDVAKELSDKLLKPLHPFLRDTERLLISPDGALNLIPFGALLDETGTYLATKKDITYLTSGRDLLRRGLGSIAKDDAVVVADPDFGPTTAPVTQAEPSMQARRSVDLDRGGMQFPALSGTAKEATVLKDLLNVGESNLLTQAKATEDRLKQLHGPPILHIATHGFFLKDNEIPAATLRLGSVSDEKAAGPIDENPLLRSGLALAGANQRRSGEKDDGILTAAEVAQMDLRSTQLVVLSACETGLGDVQNGEGVYGLRRALVLAGAESQVASLWKVADEATKDLMVDYYQRLLKGEGRSEALRHAQLAMMKSKDRSHPYYWAAFVPIGNWTPLAKSR